MKYYKFVGKKNSTGVMHDILRTAYLTYGTLIVRTEANPLSRLRIWKELSNVEIIAYVISKKYPTFKFDGSRWHQE